MQIGVRNRKGIGQIDPQERYIVISIVNMTEQNAYVKKNKNFVSVLRLRFDDITAQELGCALMDKNDADRIAEFVLRHKDKIGIIYCQCEAGISRSAGVALALCEFFEIPFENPVEFNPRFGMIMQKFFPNQHVVRLVRASLKEKSKGL